MTQPPRSAPAGGGFFMPVQMEGLMKDGYQRGHKEMAGAYGMKKAAKPKISGKGVYTGRKMPRGPKDPVPSHKGHAS